MDVKHLFGTFLDIGYTYPVCETLRVGGQATDLTHARALAGAPEIAWFPECPSEHKEIQDAPVISQPSAQPRKRRHISQDPSEQASGVGTERHTARNVARE
jgi:hypothetical protein